MRILLDHCVNHGLRRELTGHDVFTARYLGWDALHNGALLRAAADGGFDAVLTTDEPMVAQQNPATVPLPVVVVVTKDTRLAAMRPFVPAVLALLAGPPLAAGFHWVRRP